MLEKINREWWIWTTTLIFLIKKDIHTLHTWQETPRIIKNIVTTPGGYCRCVDCMFLRLLPGYSWDEIHCRRLGNRQWWI